MCRGGGALGVMMICRVRLRAFSAVLQVNSSQRVVEIECFPTRRHNRHGPRDHRQTLYRYGGDGFADGFSAVKIRLRKSVQMDFSSGLRVKTPIYYIESI